MEIIDIGQRVCDSSTMILSLIHIYCSMLVITHDLALARRLCDDIRVLYMGRIIEQGTAEEVMERPRHRCV